MDLGLVVDNTTHSSSVLPFRLNNIFTDFTFEAVQNIDSLIPSTLVTKIYSVIIINTIEITYENIQLFKSIRQHSSIPIVVFSSLFNFQMMKEAINCQINDVLTGTVSNEDIVKCINQCRNSRMSILTTENHTHKVDRLSSTKECVIEKVKWYIHNELHRQITLKQISKELHFNYAYLGQKFKRKLNISFNHYLLQQRMEKAKHLLLKTNLRIYEVAQRVGYTEIDWFYKKFKEYTGISANEYRKQFDYLYAN